MAMERKIKEYPRRDRRREREGKVNCLVMLVTSWPSISRDVQTRCPTGQLRAQPPPPPRSSKSSMGGEGNKDTSLMLRSSFRNVWWRDGRAPPATTPPHGWRWRRASGRLAWGQRGHWGGSGIPRGSVTCPSCRFLTSWASHRLVVVSSFSTWAKVVSFSWSGKHCLNASRARGLSERRR